MGKAIGIDLGTTYSVAAILKREVEIIRNKLEKETELTRSCVGYINDGFLVGNTAYDSLLPQDPVNVITSIKRLMGNGIDAENVQKMIKNKEQYKYSIIEKSFGTRDTLSVILKGREYLPEEISAEILKKIKLYSEENLEDKVTHAVITVPAYFTEKQKYATLVAAKLAGLKVQKLLPEPTAAAIAHGVDNVQKNEAPTVLIYDFGGGTFDISILSIADGQYLEIAKGGDMWLGGDDIDKLLVDYVKHKCEKEYSIESLDELINNMNTKRKYRAQHEFKRRVEELKIQLSNNENATFEFNDFITDKNGDFLEMEYTIKRTEFEKLIEPIINRATELTKELLQKINYDIDMINQVILVGGSSKIPFVRKEMERLFGEKVKYSNYPMLDVAKGAAIVAQRIGADDITSEISIEEIKQRFNFDEISHSIAHDISIFIGEDGNEEEKVLFKATDPLPSERNVALKTLYPNQRIAKFKLITNVDNEKQQTTCFINLGANYPAGKIIYCNILLDENETLMVTTQVEGETKKQSFRIGRGGASQKVGEEIEKTINTINAQRLFYDKINKATEILQTFIEKANSLDQDGTRNDKAFAEIYYKVGELPENLGQRDTKQYSDILISFIEFILATYKNELPQFVAEELNEIRTRLINYKDSLSEEELRQWDKQIDIVLSKDNLVDSLWYVLYASFHTDDLKTKKSLQNYHDKIIMYFHQNDTPQVNKLFSEAFPIAGEVYKTIGQGNKIRTGVTL